MRIQIERIAPHQNAKVFAIVWSICLAIFMIPYALIVLLVLPGVQFTHLIPMMLMPLVALPASYLSTALVVFIYNKLVQKIGPLEFDAIVTRP